MSVEGGTVAVGVRAAVSGGPAVGAGPSIGSISAPSMEGGLVRGFSPSFVNEGPVAPVFLENTMPLSFNKPLGEIIFNPTPSVIEQAEEVAATAWKATEPASEGVPLEAQMKAIKPMEYRSFFVPDLIQAQRTKTALEAASMVDLNRKVVSFLQPDAKKMYQQALQALTVSAPLSKEQQVEQVVEEEEIVVEDKVDKAPETQDEEKVEELRIKHVEDVEVSEQRRQEIRSAIQKAKLEAEKEGISEIEGWRVVKFLPPEHEGNRSQIVKKRGPDGSLSETVEALAQRAFTSLSQALKEAMGIVSEKPPVKRDKDGRPVSNEDIARIFKHHLVKRPPHEEVVLRVIKKSRMVTVRENPLQPISAVETKQVIETRIEDYPDLAEVFQKAA